jgi:hypothetical protein
MSTPTHGVEHLVHTDNQPLVFAKSGRSGSGNWKSGIQTFGIRWHRSPFKITMDLSFAHSASKRWILVTLWRLLPSQFGDNPPTSTPCKTCKTFQRLTWLQHFFKNQSGQGLSPNPCCSRRHPKNGNYHAIWLVGVFVHAIWAV